MTSIPTTAMHGLLCSFAVLSVLLAVILLMPLLERIVVRVVKRRRFPGRGQVLGGADDKGCFGGWTGLPLVASGMVASRMRDLEQGRGAAAHIFASLCSFASDRLRAKASETSRESAFVPLALP